MRAVEFLCLRAGATTETGNETQRTLRKSRILIVGFESFLLRNVLSNRRAWPFIKPFLTPNGWQDVKFVY